MADRVESYGEQGLTAVDRFGVYLSRRAIAKHIPTATTTRVLDLGCGYDASLLRWLAPQVAGGVGVDVSISDQAQQTKGLTFHQGTIEERIGELESSSFHSIYAISVLEHLWDPQRVVSECYRLLTQGGKLVINVPTWLGRYPLELSAFRFGMSPRVEMDDHKRYYNKRDLWPILRQAGFSPSEMKLRYHKFGLNLFAVATKQADQR